jgi:choline kinase
VPDRTAVILAAGIGSRLAPLTDEIPKCLVEVGDIPILHRQAAAFATAGITRIILVAGYRAPQVISAAPENCIVVENAEYRETNNMYSLSLAQQYVQGELILLNGDVVFAPEILKELLGAEQTNCIATDVGNYIDESMKISVRADGSISNISKTIPPGQALGTSIDLYRFSEAATEQLFGCISGYLRRGDKKQWSEVAINDLVKQTAVYPVDIRGRDWVEIDNLTDLKEAETRWRQAAS